MVTTFILTLVLTFIPTLILRIDYLAEREVSKPERRKSWHEHEGCTTDQRYHKGILMIDICFIIGGVVNHHEYHYQHQQGQPRHHQARCHRHHFPYNNDDGQ